MKAIVCAACNCFLGLVRTRGEAEDLAIEHMNHCQASREEYEQAVIDMKFRQITQGLGL